jgi:hypothetical protein
MVLWFTIIQEEPQWEQPGLPCYAKPCVALHAATGQTALSWCPWQLLLHRAEWPATFARLQ